MADLAAKRAGPRTGLAVSILLHLAFVSAAVLSLPWRGPPADPRSFEVSLVPPVRVAEEARIRAAPARRYSLTAAPVAPILPALPATAPSAFTAPGPAPPPAGAGESEALGKVRSLLRGSVGCAEVTFAHLSQEELDRCAKWRQAHVDPNLQIPAPIAGETGLVRRRAGLAQLSRPAAAAGLRGADRRHQAEAPEEAAPLAEAGSSALLRYAPQGPAG